MRSLVEGSGCVKDRVLVKLSDKVTGHTGGCKYKAARGDERFWGHRLTKARIEMIKY